eukprot:SAG25_NODE_202_length_11981_cov_16.926612_6_plen_115_part_00
MVHPPAGGGGGAAVAGPSPPQPLGNMSSAGVDGSNGSETGGGGPAWTQGSSSSGGGGGLGAPARNDEATGMAATAAAPTQLPIFTQAPTAGEAGASRERKGGGVAKGGRPVRTR